MAQPIRVLIADDSTRAREGLRILLATWPEVIVIGEATNGQEALHRVAHDQPDVVLMDIQMPVLDGVQTTRLIKQQWPAITVIVLTMYPTERSAALAAGADAFLMKGGPPDRLLAALGIDLVKSKS